MSNLIIGNTVIELPEVDSTNRYVKNLIKSGKVFEGMVVWTIRQTNGRGQQGNTWLSNPDENLTFSMVLTPKNLPAQKQFYLSIITSLAVVDFLNTYRIDAQIKWPNDVLINNRKIAGVLIENSLKGRRINYSIIGIGINIFQTDFPIPTATSLAQHIRFPAQEKNNPKPVLQTMLEKICSYVEKYYFMLLNGKFDELKQLYYSRLSGFQSPITITANGQQFTTRVKQVFDNGKIELQLNNGTTRIFGFKEFETVLD